MSATTTRAPEMAAVTRRKCLTLAGVPVLSGLAAYAAGGRVSRPDDTQARFAPTASPRALLQERHLPNVPVVTHLGDEVRFYDDLVKGKKVVVTFVSSRDTRASKKVMDNLAAIQRFFGDRVGDDIFLYSITRTPERDTPG